MFEKWIEVAIALMDQCEGDADLEECDADYIQEREEPCRIMVGLMHNIHAANSIWSAWKRCWKQRHNSMKATPMISIELIPYSYAEFSTHPERCLFYVRCIKGSNDWYAQRIEFCNSIKPVPKHASSCIAGSVKTGATFRRRHSWKLSGAETITDLYTIPILPKQVLQAHERESKEVLSLRGRCVSEGWLIIKNSKLGCKESVKYYFLPELKSRLVGWIEKPIAI